MFTLKKWKIKPNNFLFKHLTSLNIMRFKSHTSNNEEVTPKLMEEI